MQKNKQATEQQARYAILDGYIILDFTKVPPENRRELTSQQNVRLTNKKPVNDSIYQDCTNDPSCGWYHFEG